MKDVFANRSPFILSGRCGVNALIRQRVRRVNIGRKINTVGGTMEMNIPTGKGKAQKIKGSNVTILKICGSGRGEKRNKEP